MAKFKVRWNSIVDRYLNALEGVEVAWSRLCLWIKSQAEKEQMGNQQRSRLVLQYTAAGLMLAFFFLLVSCRTPERAPFPVEPERFVRAEKKPETLFLKREQTVIKTKDLGSTSGSIWADAVKPRELYFDERASRIGDIVNVTIPPDLQFKPETVAPAPATSGEKNEKPAEAELKLTDPFAANAANTAPLTNFKMEVVAIDASGDFFLRGSRTVQDENGQRKQMIVMARAPKRSIEGFGIDAKDLHHVQVTEINRLGTQEYESLSWDQMTSQKVSGSETFNSNDSLETDLLRKEIATAQSQLKDRASALAQERDRLLKDRQRLLGEEDRFKNGSQGPATDNAQKGPAAAGRNSPPQSNARPSPPTSPAPVSANAQGAARPPNANATPGN